MTRRCALTMGQDCEEWAMFLPCVLHSSDRRRRRENGGAHQSTDAVRELGSDVERGEVEDLAPRIEMRAVPHTDRSRCGRRQEDSPIGLDVSSFRQSAQRGYTPPRSISPRIQAVPSTPDYTVLCRARLILQTRRILLRQGRRVQPLAVKLVPCRLRNSHRARTLLYGRRRDYGGQGRKRYRRGGECLRGGGPCSEGGFEAFERRGISERRG